MVKAQGPSAPLALSAESCFNLNVVGDLNTRAGYIAR